MTISEEDIKTNNKLIFIDLNTNQIRAGVNKKLLLDTPNSINKKPPSFNEKFVKGHNSMFMNSFPAICNFINLEFTIDLILQRLNIHDCTSYDLILTVTPFMPKYLEESLLKFLFQVYGYRRIQLGVTPVYLFRYLKGYEEIESSMIINCGYSSSFVLFKKQRFYLPIGFAFYLEMLQKLCKLKFEEIGNKKNYDFDLISKHLRVSLDYNQESVEIIKKIYSGVDVSLDISQMLVQHNRADHLKEFHRRRTMDLAAVAASIIEHPDSLTDRSSLSNEECDEEMSTLLYEDTRVEIPSNNISPTDNLEEEEQEEAISTSDLDQETELESPEQLKKRLKKEALAENLIYHSKLYQLRTKIKKTLILINARIEENKKIYFKKVDPTNFLISLKEALKKILINEQKIDLFKRNHDISKLTANLNAQSELTIKEQILLNEITKANDVEAQIVNENEKTKLLKEIKELEPDFSCDIIKFYELFNGIYFGKEFLNVELIRIPEALFNPNVFRMTFVGLREIFERLYSENLNVVLTGNYIVKGMEERVEVEMRRNVKAGRIGKIISMQTYNVNMFEMIDDFPIIERTEFLQQFREDKC
ncbi:hypothetical protein CDIK_0081 [Cucumispora dikerogammari]|nr:hypothetical protein CDIK_0081 [Cucumispora dikerogammari]